MTSILPAVGRRLSDLKLFGDCPAVPTNDQTGDAMGRFSLLMPRCWRRLSRTGKCYCRGLYPGWARAKVLG